jgi:dTDP-4-amino-4,6-dideoxygalactose transaminase
MINVTSTFLPPIEEYLVQVEKIWQSKILTNRGKLTLELEEKLKEYLKVPNLTLMNNGTIPIQIALKILGNGCEVITTPFSYVATTSSIVWENLTPVFVDIDPDYLSIDENKIEKAITENTKCILATHVFGNPCNIKIIEKIAKKHNLFIIYDAAHAFGVKYEDISIFNYGDISTCSFHATKLFHTGEGGALFCNNEQYLEKSFYSHNFGHKGPLDFYGLGINGKISELQSAMGLSVFPYIVDIISGRKKIVDYYNSKLSFSHYKTMKLRDNTDWNYSYYPIIFEDEKSLLKVQIELNNNEIYPRRYFYPSLNKLKYVSSLEMPISESISSKILCLPLSNQIDEIVLKNICEIVDNNCSH